MKYLLCEGIVTLSLICVPEFWFHYLRSNIQAFQKLVIRGEHDGGRGGHPEHPRCHSTREAPVAFMAVDLLRRIHSTAVSLLLPLALATAS